MPGRWRFRRRRGGCRGSPRWWRTWLPRIPGAGPGDPPATRVRPHPARGAGRCGDPAPVGVLPVAAGGVDRVRRHPGAVGARSAGAVGRGPGPGLGRRGARPDAGHPGRLPGDRLRPRPGPVPVVVGRGLPRRPLGHGRGIGRRGVGRTATGSCSSTSRRWTCAGCSPPTPTWSGARNDPAAGPRPGPVRHSRTRGGRVCGRRRPDQPRGGGRWTGCRPGRGDRWGGQCAGPDDAGPDRRLLLQRLVAVPGQGPDVLD